MASISQSLRCIVHACEPVNCIVEAVAWKHTNMDGGPCSIWTPRIVQLYPSPSGPEPGDFSTHAAIQMVMRMDVVVVDWWTVMFVKKR